MKTNRIKSLCREAKEVQIVCGMDDAQWIGTSNAIYPANGLTITEASISVLFDMDVKGSMKTETKDIDGCDLVPRQDDWAHEMPIMYRGSGIEYVDETMIPLCVQDKVFMVREKEMRAAESTEGYQVFRLAHNAYDEPVIVIEDGMICTGLVRPVPQRTVKSVLAYLQGLTNLMPCGAPDREQRKEEQGQVTMEDHLLEAPRDMIDPFFDLKDD